MHTVSLIDAVLLTAKLNASDNTYKELLREQVLLSLLLAPSISLLLDSESDLAYTLPNNTAFTDMRPPMHCKARAEISIRKDSNVTCQRIVARIYCDMICQTPLRRAWKNECSPSCSRQTRRLFSQMKNK
jgi:hypothetical protein